MKTMTMMNKTSLYNTRIKRLLVRQNSALRPGVEPVTWRVIIQLDPAGTVAHSNSPLSHWDRLC